MADTPDALRCLTSSDNAAQLSAADRDTTQKLVSVCGIIQYRSVHCTVCTKQKQLRDQCYSEYETVLLADAFNYNL